MCGRDLVGSQVDSCVVIVADVPTDGIHTTEWEREREREEFAQAARLYRPLSAMIASRFTRAKYDDDDKASLPADDSVCYFLSLSNVFVNGPICRHNMTNRGPGGHAG